MYNGSMLVGIKVGSSLLTDDEGVSRDYLFSLCDQIAWLKSLYQRVFLVTSGAVASEPLDGLTSNLRAAIGQASLIGEYRKFFEPYGIKVAQILVADNDFNKNHDTIAVRTIEEALELNFRWIIPIINANDVVSDKELEALSICADNDRLSQLICERLGVVDIMIIGMDEEGLKNEKNQVVHLITRKDSLKTLFSYAGSGSEKGFGNDGMKTKISVAYHLMKLGIRVVLAPGRAKDFILRAVAGEDNFGTTFLPG